MEINAIPGTEEYYYQIGFKKGWFKAIQIAKDSLRKHFLSLGDSEEEAQKKVDLLIPEYDPFK